MIRMEINIQKILLSFNKLAKQQRQWIKIIFTFQTKIFEDALRCIGFELKANDYRITDQEWLIMKIARKISSQYNKWFSIGGHLTLVQATLEATSVHWMSISIIPKGNINQIKRRCLHYLWIGQKDKMGMTLVRWSRLAQQKSLVGQGLKDLYIFGKALDAKSL